MSLSEKEPNLYNKVEPNLVSLLVTGHAQFDRLPAF